MWVLDFTYAVPLDFLFLCNQLLFQIINYDVIPFDFYTADIIP